MDETLQNQAEESKDGISRKAADILSLARRNYLALSPQGRGWLTAAAGLTLLSVIALIWFGTRTDWRVLFAGLEPADARSIAAELTTAGIPFDVSPDGGTLRVPADRLDKARLATTAKGGPRSGRMGFDLFDKPNWIGSDFDEKVNYQRALEGELEHTIGTLSAVQSARVHLVMPHDSLFTDQQRDAKASVVLKLRTNRLSEDEVASIRNLVASAVDDLRPENVTLIDADGRVQLGKKSATAEAEAHEQELAAKLIETLEPVAGPGNVRASVNVEYDSSSADEVDETYDPAKVVALSMQRSEQTTGTLPTPAGVPGTASNTPNVKPPLFPTQNPGTQNIRQESGTYGASKQVLHKLQGPGKIRRITAAVLINDRLQLKGRQKAWQARTPEEMKHLADIAQATVGFDPSRGDLVTVENLPFERNAGEPEPSFSSKLMQAANLSTPALKYVFLLLIFAGIMIYAIRPGLRHVMRQLPAGSVAASTELPLPEQAAEDKLLETETQGERQKLKAQALFEQVSEQFARDPVQTTRLLQSWIHTE